MDQVVLAVPGQSVGSQVADQVVDGGTNGTASAPDSGHIPDPCLESRTMFDHLDHQLAVESFGVAQFDLGPDRVRDVQGEYFRVLEAEEVPYGGAELGPFVGEDQKARPTVVERIVGQPQLVLPRRNRNMLARVVFVVAIGPREPQFRAQGHGHSFTVTHRHLHM